MEDHWKLKLLDLRPLKEIKDEIFRLRGIPQSKQIIIPYNKEPVNDYSNALIVIHEYFTADLKYVVEKTKKKYL